MGPPLVLTSVTGVTEPRCAGSFLGNRTRVLMDEPTAALGVAETARVEDIIRGLKARNLPIPIISHSLDQVFCLSDRISVLRRGRQIGVRRPAR